MRGARASVVSLAMLVAGAAVAGEYEVGPTLGLMSGGEFDVVGAPGSPDFATSPTLGVTADRRIGTDRWLEFVWLRQWTEFPAGDLSPAGGEIDLFVDHLHAGGVYRPASRGVQPFVAFTAGVSWIDPEGFDGQLTASAAISAGAAIPVAPHWWLRLRGRGFMLLGDASYSGRCGGAACSFELSGEGVFQFEAVAEVAVRFGRRAQVRRAGGAPGGDGWPKRTFGP